MAHDVFVSYSNKDKLVADAVVAGLEGKGIRCWVAPRDITPGTTWGQAIVSAIDTSKIMVIILSGNSNRSRQVVREVERAVARDVIIVPFRIENIDPTGAMAYYLSTEHWLDAINAPMEEHIQKLASTIQLFQREGKPPVDLERTGRPGMAARKPGLRGGLVWLGLASILLLVFVVLGAIFLPHWLDKGSPLATATRSEMSTPSASPIQSTPTSGLTFQKVGEYRTSGSANGLFITGDTLYVSNGFYGLLSLSINDPGNPTLLTSYKADDAQEAVVVGDMAYIINGDSSGKLLLLPLNSPDNSTSYPAAGKNLGSVTGLIHVAVANGIAHVTSHNYWSILDIKDPQNPKTVWTWTPPKSSGQTCQAVLDGTIAYIACGWAGLFIFDITDVQNPRQVGIFETPGWIIDLALQEKTIYLSMGDSGVITLDVNDPARPLMMDILRLPGFAGYIAVSGDRLYVVSGTEIYAINVASSGAMTILATYTGLYAGSDIQATKDHIYVADKAHGVIVLSLGSGK